MIKYPVGIQTFEEIRENGFLYIDKTQYVYDLCHPNKYIFLSRPRRFGKSLLTSTFYSYFRGRKDLFQGLAIEELETEWKEYPVLYFSLATAKQGTPEDLFLQINIQLDWLEKFNGLSNNSSISSPGARMQTDVMQLFTKTGKKVVVLIDEYDAPMLTVLHDETRLKELRTAMQSFYAPLKDLDPYLRFVFVTGITKFSQLSIFSQLNNLTNISMMPKYATICGITQKELETNFQEGIRLLAESEGYGYEDALLDLQRKYDGYHFAHNSEGVYNPFSLLSSMRDSDLDNYWFATGTPSFLIKMMRKFHTDLTQLDGSEALNDEFDAPTEDMHSILPLFYQSGYLTITDYNRRSRRYTLGFPNEEVKVGMMKTLIPYFVSQNFNAASTACWHISEALLDDDINKALDAARSYFASIPYQEGTLKDAPTTEGHFTGMLYVMFSFLNMYVYSQVRVSRGRMDILLQTDTSVYVMELKMNSTPEEALAQIDDKGYAIPWQAGDKKIVKVGINFSSKERTIKNWKAIYA